MVKMENSEEVLQILDRFTRLKQKEIPKELDEYLQYVAKTGDTVFNWDSLKYLFREKLLNVIKHFHDTSPRVEEIPQYPNVDPFNYESMKSSLLERLELFNAAPFTIQRLCELLIDPRKQYSRIDKFMRALEKNILVVSTIEPGRKRTESENGDSLDSVVNGDLSLDVNVDIDMENESLFNMEAQNGNGIAGPENELAIVAEIDETAPEGLHIEDNNVKKSILLESRLSDDECLPNPKKPKLDIDKKENEQIEDVEVDESEKAVDHSKEESDVKDDIEIDENKLDEKEEQLIENVEIVVPIEEKSVDKVDGDAEKMVLETEEDLDDVDDNKKSVYEVETEIEKNDIEVAEKDIEKKVELEETVEKEIQEDVTALKIPEEEIKDDIRESKKAEVDTGTEEKSVTEEKESDIKVDVSTIKVSEVLVNVEETDSKKIDEENKDLNKAKDEEIIEKEENKEIVKEDVSDKEPIKQSEETNVNDADSAEKKELVENVPTKENKDEVKDTIAAAAVVPEEISSSLVVKSDCKIDVPQSTESLKKDVVSDDLVAEVENATERTKPDVPEAKEIDSDKDIKSTEPSIDLEQTEKILPKDKVEVDVKCSKTLPIEVEIAEVAVETSATAPQESSPVAKVSDASDEITESSPRPIVSTEEKSIIPEGEVKQTIIIKDKEIEETPASNEIGIVVTPSDKEVSAKVDIDDHVSAVIPISTELPQITPTLALNDQPMEEENSLDLDVAPVVEEVIMAESSINGGNDVTAMATDATEPSIPAKDEPAGMDVDDSQEAMDQSSTFC